MDGLAIVESTGAIPENVAFAIQWAQMEAFLENEGIAPSRERSTQPLSATDIAALARQVTVSIDCAQ